jgi:hypothetical protein
MGLSDKCLKMNKMRDVLQPGVRWIWQRSILWPFEVYLDSTWWNSF